MADSLIRPEVPAPKGVPPKKLIVAIFGVLAVGALGMAAISDPGQEPNTGDAVAREAAATLSDTDKVELGAGAAAVADEANKSGLPAAFKGPEAKAPASQEPTTQQAGAGARRDGSEPAHVLNPIPEPIRDAPMQVAPMQVSDRDGVRAARDVEALQSNMMVLDEDPNRADSEQRAERATHQDDPVEAVEKLARDFEKQQQKQRMGGGGASAAPTLNNPMAMLSALQPKEAKVGGPSQLDQQFLQEFSAAPAREALRPVRPEAKYMVMEGTVIPAVLTRDVVSDLPGVITAQVSRDVYDSIHSRYRLICKGTRLVGRYSSDVREGRDRLLFAFSRMTLPSGVSYDLDGFDGSDQAGSAGVVGDVDNHFLKLFGSALAIGLLADRATRPAAVPQGTNASISATGQILVETARQQLERGRNVTPTITIERGALINVEVRRDMLFPAPTSKDCK